MCVLHVVDYNQGDINATKINARNRGRISMKVDINFG